jgi:hypothetical protein
MYSNIGRKIKILAMVIGWLGLAAGVVAWFILITDTWNGRYITADDGAGCAALGAGVALLLSSWFLYGFGELIESVGEIAINSVKPTASIFCSDNTDKPAKSVFKSVNNVEPTAETYSSAFTENQNKIPAWKRVEMEKQNQENE